MVTTSTAANITTTTAERPVRWHTIHFAQPAVWEAFRKAEPVLSCNPHLWRRWARAAALYETGRVSHDVAGVWRVQSQSVAGESYTVTLDPHDGARCECGDAVWREQAWCKHALAVFITAHMARQAVVSAATA
jgi:hypothetical protein